MPITVAVLNEKGGVGKSTIATNIAAAAHLSGRRTILLDLDKQGTSFDWYSARRENSKLNGLTVARADKALDLRKFRELSKGFDVAVCDGPPHTGDITRAAAVAADVVVIPLRPGFFDWWACADTIALMDSADSIRVELQRQPLRRLFVINGATANTRMARQAQEAIAGAGGEVFPEPIITRQAYAMVTQYGESVFTEGNDAVAVDEMKRLWESILTPPAQSSQVSQ